MEVSSWPTDEMVRVADKAACRESKTFGYFCGRSERHEMLKVALSAALAAMWQPIETAPKDGSFFDAWVGGEFPHRSTDVSWREPTDSEWWVHGGDTIETPEATWCDDFGPLGKDSAPTHWMPKLPAPSQLSKRDDAERDSRQEA